MRPAGPLKLCVQNRLVASHTWTAPRVVPRATSVDELSKADTQTGAPPWIRHDWENCSTSVLLSVTFRESASSAFSGSGNRAEIFHWRTSKLWAQVIKNLLSGLRANVFRLSSSSATRLPIVRPVSILTILTAAPWEQKRNRSSLEIATFPPV